MPGVNHGRLALSPPLRGFDLCRRCKCETEQCGRKRRAFGESVGSSSTGRWCFQCGSAEQTLSSNKVMNAYGVTALPGSWAPLLRSVANLSYLWPHLEPCDIDALHSFMQFLQANVEWGIGFLVWAVLAYHCKWPMAVQALRGFMASRQAQRQQQMLSAPTLRCSWKLSLLSFPRSMARR